MRPLRSCAHLAQAVTDRCGSLPRAARMGLRLAAFGSYWSRWDPDPFAAHPLVRAASRTAPRAASRAGLAEQGAAPAAGPVARLRGVEVGVPAFAVWPAASGAAGWDGAADWAAPRGA